MRIEEVRARLTIDALNELLASWLKSDQIKAVAPGHGDTDAVHIQCDYRFGPISTPIELTVKVAEVNSNSLDLAVSSPNLSATATQELLRTLLNSIGIEGLDARNSHLIVNWDKVGAALGVRFKLQSLNIEGSEIQVELRAIELPQNILKLILPTPF